MVWNSCSQPRYRYIDEDGDALIDFDSRAKGEWVFKDRFENLITSDTFRSVAFGEMQSHDDLVLDDRSDIV